MPEGRGAGAGVNMTTRNNTKRDKEGHSFIEYRHDNKERKERRERGDGGCEGERYKGREGGWEWEVGGRREESGAGGGAINSTHLIEL